MLTRGRQSTWLWFSASWVCLKQNPRKPCTQTQHHITWCCRIVSWRQLLAKSSLLFFSLSFFFLTFLAGTKHKTMLEARNGSGAIKAFPRAGVKGKGPANKGNTGLQNKTFHCEICDVHVNSETQLKQVGRAHPGSGGAQGMTLPALRPVCSSAPSHPSIHLASYSTPFFTCA